jgi:ubiquinol-cytochrome c reductase cytochrome c subunit
VGVLVLTLVAIGIAYAALAPHSRAAGPTSQVSAQVAGGRALFLSNCSSCHGLNAQGTSLAPSLIGVGPAAVDFQVSSGRMPLAKPDAQARRKKPKFDQAEIDQLSAYVGSLAPGPNVPSANEIDISKGNVAEGGELFRTNCSQCHNFNGSGGALTYGKFAPSLYPATARQIYEAMLTGPSNMPVFSDNQLTPDQKRDIIAFIKTTHAQPDPGGLSLGRVGPVPEGAVGFLVGIMGCVVATLWIGARL